MSGPYCESCEHFQSDPIQLSHNKAVSIVWGICTDPDKRIYWKHGDEHHASPTVTDTDYCSNHNSH